MMSTMTSDYITIAKNTVLDLKKSNPNTSNQDLINSIAPYWELLNEEERKEVVLYAIKTSFMKFD